MIIRIKCKECFGRGWYNEPFWKDSPHQCNECNAKGFKEKNIGDLVNRKFTREEEREVVHRAVKRCIEILPDLPYCWDRVEVEGLYAMVWSLERKAKNILFEESRKLSKELKITDKYYNVIE